MHSIETKKAQNDRLGFYRQVVNAHPLLHIPCNTVFPLHICGGSVTAF